MILGLGSSVSILVSAVLSAGPPLGGAAGSVAPGGQDEGAQQAFRAGVEAARQERWVDARTQFEKAYSLSSRPVVLVNLAGAQARTGRLTEAAKNYHRILDDDMSPETASFRRAAAEVLPALEARIPRVRLNPAGLSPSDVVRIDGEVADAAALGSGQPLDPGEHTLAVNHGGVERARVLFTLAERELRYITLPPPVAPPPGPIPAVAVGVPAFDQPLPGVTERERTTAWWASPWTWTAAALVVAGASVATFLVLENRDQSFSGNIPPGQISVR